MATVHVQASAYRLRQLLFCPVGTLRALCTACHGGGIRLLLPSMAHDKNMQADDQSVLSPPRAPERFCSRYVYGHDSFFCTMDTFL